VNLGVLGGRRVYPARLIAAALVLPVLLFGDLVGLDYRVNLKLAFALEPDQDDNDRSGTLIVPT
jgi:hypothetical protein